MESLGLTRLFGGAYEGRRTLVTGHTGFKGSWMAAWLQQMGAHVGGIALDPETDPSHWTALRLDIPFDMRMDIRDGAATIQAVQEFAPEIVFHLAAQPLVRRSYRQPKETVATNVMGLVHVLEGARAAGTGAFVNVTTDKVYRQRTDARPFREDDPLGGHDPYSTSKACAELVSECYRSSWGRNAGGTLALATARSGNVVGGGDWAEDRLLPDLVRAVETGVPLQVRHPDATRPWQHVLEPLSGYLLLGQRLLAGDPVEGAWNFGPGAAMSARVGDVIDLCRELVPDLVVRSPAGNSPHEAAELALDAGKAADCLGWSPVWNLRTTIQRTLAWYQAYRDDGSVRTIEDLARFVHDARAAEQPWAG